MVSLKMPSGNNSAVLMVTTAITKATAFSACRYNITVPSGNNSNNSTHSNNDDKNDSDGRYELGTSCLFKGVCRQMHRALCCHVLTCCQKHAMACHSTG